MKINFIKFNKLKKTDKDDEINNLNINKSYSR
jgi:hypothetical protein